MAIKGRVPIIALDYSQKHKAVQKELMIDYTNGNIYIVSADSRDVIFDITSKVAEQIEGLQGNQVIVNIEGIGEVNLTDYLNKIQLELENGVKIIDSAEDATYVGKDRVLDDRSLDTTDSLLIEVKGFAQAEDLQIPRKRAGNLEWVDVTEIFSLGNGNGTGGNDTIIPPSNPYDGLSLRCLNIAPVNGVVYLRASKRQKSINLNTNCIVVLPEVLDEYSEIKWYMVTNSFVPNLAWQNNIVWKNNARQVTANAHCIFRAETWDFGQTWIAVLETYDATLPEGGVDKAYLNENYYNKNQIDLNFSDNSELQANYYNKDQVNSNFVSNKTMSSDYYNKDQVDEFLSFDNYSNPNNNK